MPPEYLLRIAAPVLNPLSVDAVLLDLLMPRMGGLDVLRRIKTIDPHIGVILVTAVDEIPTVVGNLVGGLAFTGLTLYATHIKTAPKRVAA